MFPCDSVHSLVGHCMNSRLTNSAPLWTIPRQAKKLTLDMLWFSLVRKGFTLLHIYDTVTRALVSPQAWDAPPPAFGCDALAAVWTLPCPAVLPQQSQ